MALPDKASITAVQVVVKDSSELGISLPTFLPAPELEDPLSGKTLWDQTYAGLEWEAVSEADSYEVQVSLDSDFSTWKTYSVETELTDIKVGMFEVAAAVDEHHYPLKDHTYSWRVRSIKDNLSSPWSEVWTFSIATTPTEDLPRPPYVDEVVPESAEVKPQQDGQDEDLSKSGINVFMSDSGGAVVSYSWSCSRSYRDGGLLKSERRNDLLSNETATGCEFTAPALSTLDADEVCNVGKGATFTIKFKAQNEGGSSSSKCEINCRFQAGDYMSVEPTAEGADWSAEAEE
jgi:hypothetical protein